METMKSDMSDHVWREIDGPQLGWKMKSGLSDPVWMAIDDNQPLFL